MPTVSDLKNQARTLEQQGELGKALAIYAHILKHVEGTPAIAKLIPLYVKVGDLHAKQNQLDEAVAAYEKAAERYAENGSAQRVSSLCAKIARISPQRTGVHTHFARRLLEHGHVGSARDVLSEYAQLAGLDGAQEALDELAGRPSEEIKPMLEGLLESGMEGGAGEAEEAARRVSTQLSHVTDQEAGELTTAPVTGPVPAIAVEESQEESPEPLTPPMIDFGAPIEVSRPAPTERVTEEPQQEEVEPAAEETPEQLPEEAGEPEAAATAGVPSGEPARGSVPWITSDSAEPETTDTLGREDRDRETAGEARPGYAQPPRPSARPIDRPLRPTPRFMTPESERSRRSPVLFGVIGFVVGVAVGAFGRGFVAPAAQETVPVAVPDTAAPVASPPAVESTLTTPATDSLSEISPAPIIDSVMEPVAVTDSADTGLAAPAATPDTQPPQDTIPAQAEPAQPVAGGYPIVVDGLEIESVREATYQGRVGYRVVHLLDSGDTFTVESYGDTTAGPGTGRITVNTTPPDTVVGILRMDGYLVIASGVVPEDSLRALMARLVEGERP